MLQHCLTERPKQQNRNLRAVRLQRTPACSRQHKISCSRTYVYPSSTSLSDAQHHVATHPNAHKTFMLKIQHAAPPPPSPRPIPPPLPPQTCASCKKAESCDFSGTKLLECYQQQLRQATPGGQGLCLIDTAVRTVLKTLYLSLLPACAATPTV